MVWYHFPNALASIDAVMAFAVHKEFVSIVTNRFPQVEFVHAAASTISYGIELAASNTQAAMYIVLHEGLLEICLIENNKLKLYNTFAFQSIEIKTIDQDIKQCFFCLIGCGSYWQICRRLQTNASPFSTNYSHKRVVNKVKKEG